MKDEYEEIDLKAFLEQRFAAGQGFVTLPVNMTDEQILTLIKNACTWSQGKAFQVIPPKVETETHDWSQLEPFTCPYCGCPTPEGDELVLDAWGVFPLRRKRMPRSTSTGRQRASNRLHQPNTRKLIITRPTQCPAHQTPKMMTPQKT